MRSETVSFVRWRYDLLIAGLTVMLSLFYIVIAGGNFPLDDSWIHQTYARNLAQNGEWAFIAGEPSTASTSPLYTVVLAIGYLLNIPYHVWTHGVGIVMLALTGILGARMAARLIPNNRSAYVATGLALVMAWHLIWAAVSGMETAIFAMFTLALITLAWRELDARSQHLTAIILRGMLFGLVAALTTLTRAEGVLLCALLGGLLIFVRPGGRYVGWIAYGVAALFVFMIVLAPYLNFNLQQTGGLLPDTAAAKQMYATPNFYQSYFWRVGYLLEPLAAGGQMLLLPGIVVFAVMLVRQRRSLLLSAPLLWSVLLILLYAGYLPLNFQHGRYVIPSLPSAIVCGVVGMILLLKGSRFSLLGRVFTRTLAGATIFVFIFFTFSLGVNAYRLDVAIIDEEMVATAFYLRDNIPPDQLLVTNDIGAVGYFAPRPILDIAGLISPEIIPILNNPDEIWAWMQAQGGRYLRALNDQVPGDDVNDPRLCPVFTTGGTAAVRAGGTNMTIYKLAYDGVCDP